MNNLSTFESCCEYLGISSELPKCEVDQKQFQAAYKLRVCMKAWNKQDGFEPDEKADWKSDNVGFTPHFYLKKGKLLSSGYAYNGSLAGIVVAYASNSAATTLACFGLRISFETQNRAIEFGKTFIDIFNELI